VIEVDGVGPIAAHPGEQYPARFRLLENIGDSLRSPVGVGTKVQGMALYGEGLGGAQCHTAVTAHAGGLLAVDPVLLFVVDVDVVGALSHTHLTGDAALFIAVNAKFGR